MHVNALAHFIGWQIPQLHLAIYPLCDVEVQGKPLHRPCFLRLDIRRFRRFLLYILMGESRRLQRVDVHF